MSFAKVPVIFRAAARLYATGGNIDGARRSGKRYSSSAPGVNSRKEAAANVFSRSSSNRSATTNSRGRSPNPSNRRLRSQASRGGAAVGLTVGNSER